ncbi:MAG: DivIVA domain-containing protein [Ruminococcus sp.]|nr:DivIVA domain-containing protein [Ruminococcus sp.]MCM1480297.1 DivIVA domain-containing protein [Muribaculaceae bacterium]
MLSVKDINNKRFEQARPGYKTEEVDDFLREISLQIGQYQREKEDLEKKIEVLVESVREYKKDEDALKDALIGAQKQGRIIVSEAQSKATEILADANKRASEIIGSTTVQLEKEKRCLVRMQQEVSDFKASLLSMYKQHLEQITAIPDYEDDSEEAAETRQPVQPAAPQQAPVQQAVPQEEIPAPAEQEQNMEATRVMENPLKPEKNPFPFDEHVNVGAVRAESKFGDLKFGQNK